MGGALAPWAFLRAKTNANEGWSWCDVPLGDHIHRLPKRLALHRQCLRPDGACSCPSAWRQNLFLRKSSTIHCFTLAIGEKKESAASRRPAPPQFGYAASRMELPSICLWDGKKYDIYPRKRGQDIDSLLRNACKPLRAAFWILFSFASGRSDKEHGPVYPPREQSLKT